MTQKSDLTELFKQASEIASVVPEAMQAEAFNRALELLRGTGSNNTPQFSNNPPVQPTHLHNDSKRQAEQQADATEWIDSFSSSSHPEVFEAGKILDKALIILKIARDDYGVPSLSAATISRVLKEKFHEKADVSAVRMALGRALSLIDRTKDASGGFTYRLMRPGELYLEGDESQLKKSAGRKIATAKTKPDASNSQAKPDGKGSKKSKKTSTSRPGPKAMLEQLIAEGYFQKPKLVNDIVTHASQNMGYTYSINELSGAFIRLLRQQKIVRKHNSDGQYEYTAK